MGFAIQASLTLSILSMRPTISGLVSPGRFKKTLLVFMTLNHILELPLVFHFLNKLRSVDFNGGGIGTVLTSILLYEPEGHLLGSLSALSFSL